MGKCGYDKAKTFTCTFELNEKGGIKEVELEIYLSINVIPLYPDSLAVIWKRVCNKLDTCSEKFNSALIAWLCLQGIYVYLTPNTTEFTQEKDKSHGLWKTRFGSNWNECWTNHLLLHGLLKCWIVCFWGADPETNTKDIIFVWGVIN